MKKIILTLTVALLAVMLAVSASAAVSMSFDLEETTTDDGQPVNVIVATLTDDEGDWRALKIDISFDNNIIIPVDYLDGSIPDYSDAEGAMYPFAFGSYKTGRTNTEISIIDGPNWVMNGENSTMGFESYWSQLEKYPIDATEGFVVFELFFKFADGKSADDFTANSFKIDYVHYADGTNHFIGNADASLNDIVLTNNVVPEAPAPTVITIPVVAGDKIYLQDGSVVTAEATGDYEVPATVGYVAVNTGNSSQKTYYVDGTTATQVHTNGVFESAYDSLRDRTPVYDKATGKPEDRNGIRFKFNHNPAGREIAGHEIVEVGFIITADSNKVLTNMGANYVLDMNMVDKGFAKVGKVFGDGRNTVMNTTQDDAWVMAAVFYNIPITESGVQTKIVSRPYYKVGDAYIYGEVTSATLYEKATAIKNNAEEWKDCEESKKKYINEIIAQVDGWTEVIEEEIVIDVGSLYE